MEKIEQAIFGLEKKFPQYSLRLWHSRINKISLYSGIFFAITMLTLASITTYIFLFYFLNILYLIAQSFKIIVTIIGLIYQPKATATIKNNVKLPLYTILVPLYKEDKIISHLIESLDAINYPKNLLEIKLLIEEDDELTKANLAKEKLPEYYEMILVPFSHPRTKPKACNYGLLSAKGKYITIYDAEDRPDPDQLKKIVHLFTNSSKETICIQARLNFYNRKENIITKLFSIEYSLLFDYMLSGIKKLSFPIPLGGTSNHFIREKLIEVGGWDAFNVTEDADLGIRIHHFGYKTGLIDSTTLEEAPITIDAWIKQRARWIKGHILTSLLHLKQFDKLKFNEFIGILFTLYLPNIIYITLPIYLLLGCVVIDKIKHDLFWQINLAIGIILPIISSILVILIKKWESTKAAIFCSFIYYFLFPIAGIRSCWQILTAPFHWDKTNHGVSNILKEKNEI